MGNTTPDLSQREYVRKSYKTLDHFAQAEFTEKKSIFVAWAAPITCEDDANQLIAQAKAKYPDAKHHVYAWILGGLVQRNKYSDDGEPSGTAGLPVLDILLNHCVEDAILIVTRYFGGTLLGTGGLVRAYSGAALLAIESAQPVEMLKCAVYRCIASYSDFAKIKRALKDLVFELHADAYGENILFEISQDYDNKEALLPAFQDAGCGRASIEFVGIRYMKKFCSAS